MGMKCTCQAIRTAMPKPLRATPRLSATYLGQSPRHGIIYSPSRAYSTCRHIHNRVPHLNPIKALVGLHDSGGACRRAANEAKAIGNLASVVFRGGLPCRNVLAAIMWPEQLLNPSKQVFGVKG